MNKKYLKSSTPLFLIFFNKKSTLADIKMSSIKTKIVLIDKTGRNPANLLRRNRST
jgi:hypothetical protein